MYILFIGLIYTSVYVLAVDNSFEVSVVNVTVIEGSTAVLPCSVSQNIQKIAWLDQWSTILTYKTDRVIDDLRISVNQPYPTEWNLQITGVKYGDQGIYTCHFNSEPVKDQTVVLNVIVPPRIIGSQTPSHIVTKEGRSVSLICNVTGVPRPTVTWYRKQSVDGDEKERELQSCLIRSRIGYKGEELIIHNVTRYCGGIYECLADNNVPPAVKKQIRVDVEFPPEIRLPTKRIGQSKGRETILECVVTAFPHAVSVWQFRGRELSNSWKYRIEVFEEEIYTKTLSLRIVQLDERDYGVYMCVASNNLGKTTDTMELYEHRVRKPTTQSTSTISVTPGLLSRGRDRKPVVQSDKQVDSPLLKQYDDDEDEDDDTRINYIDSRGNYGRPAAVDGFKGTATSVCRLQTVTLYTALCFLYFLHH